MRTLGLRYMTLDEVAGELSKEFWCCPRISAREVSLIEQVALEKMREKLRESPSGNLLAESLWTFIEGNPNAIERGALPSLANRNPTGFFHALNSADTISDELACFEEAE